MPLVIPVNRRFVPSTLPQYVQIPKRYSIFVRLSIDDCHCVRTLTMFTSLVTSANLSCSVVVQSYECSLFFIVFCNFLNKINEIMGRTIKSKGNAKTGCVNWWIFDVSWNKLTSIKGGLLHFRIEPNHGGITIAATSSMEQGFNLKFNNYTASLEALYFLDPESSLPCSQKSPYLEPDHFSPSLLAPFIQNPLLTLPPNCT
jgi:hypothetical protein